MPELVWNNDLRLDQPQMDRTHEEFVQLLAQARAMLAADESERALASFEDLVEHTTAHFGQEDRWMAATGFSPDNCHARQHGIVLQVMREVLRLARDEGRWDSVRAIADELAEWFPQHARMMDAALAQHMAEVGFDPATGKATLALPQAAITHCGGCG
jgi:hemerythrin-like metal-binding protein